MFQFEHHLFQSPINHYLMYSCLHYENLQNWILAYEYRYCDDLVCSPGGSIGVVTDDTSFLKT